DAVPAFEMAPGVPGDGSDAIAELDAVTLQALRYFERAPVDFGIIGAMDGAFDRPCHDLLGAVEPGCMLDNAVTKQRPILHQSLHKGVPPVCVIACRGDHGFDMK